MKGKEKESEVLRVDLPIDVIDPNPDNSSIFNMDDIDALADSIKRNGFRGAIEVFQKKDGRYEILAGHRRYMAAKKIGLSRIPSLIYMQPKNEIEKRNLLIDSNIYNREFTPLDRARAIKYQRDTFKMEQLDNHDLNIWDALTKHFGVGRGSISTYLSIIELIPELQEMYAHQALPVYVAPTLASKSEEMQKIISDGLRKIIITQKPDVDGKKRLSAAQINIVIERAEEEYTINQLEDKIPQARVQDHYFDTSTLTSSQAVPFASNISPNIPEEQIEGQKAFEKIMQSNPFVSSTVPSMTIEPATPIIMEEAEEKEEDETIPAIDTAFEMLTIQVKNLVRGNINVVNKNKARENISSIREALAKIEKEL